MYNIPKIDLAAAFEEWWKNYVNFDEAKNTEDWAHLSHFAGNYKCFFERGFYAGLQKAEAHIEQLILLIEQLRGALGYPVKGDIPENPEIVNGIAQALNQRLKFLLQQNQTYKAAFEDISSWSAEALAALNDVESRGK